MIATLLPAAPAVKYSAPNKEAWTAEIHTPAAEYSANTPMSMIVPDPRNRKDHDPAALQSLADQISAEGLLQPIVLRSMKNGTWQIIAGERRFLAFKLLEMKTIPAMIRKSETDLSAARKQAIENEGREDLNPIERARNYQRLIELGDKQKNLMELFKLSQPVISNTLRLLELPAVVQDLVASGKLSQAHGVVLVKWAKWKRVCECIALNSISDRWVTAKSLGEDKLPFRSELVKAGLIVEICVDPEDYQKRPCYVIPKELQKDPDFIADGYRTWCYVLPTDEKAVNKWLPEKTKQDLARTQKKAAEKEKAASGDDTKKSPEQKARAKKIADNKAARAKIVTAQSEAEERLKTGLARDVSKACAIVCQKASCRGYGVDLETEAARIGIKLPAKFDGYSAESWAALSINDALLLVAAGIVSVRSTEQLRHSGAVPDEVNFIIGGKGK